MTALAPKVNESGKYTISQASSALGIHRNTLREYTNQGLIKCGFRRESGRRFYDGREILRFWNARI